MMQDLSSSRISEGQNLESSRTFKTHEKAILTFEAQAKDFSDANELRNFEN